MNDNFNREIFEVLYANADFEAGIQQTLAMIGERFAVSRAYIFENEADGRYANNTFEWCSKGIEPQIDNLQHCSNEEYNYMEMFDENGIFFCADVSQLPPIHRELFEMQGIKATIQFAMFDKREFRGFIGFDDCLAVRPDWRDDHEIVDTLVFLSKLLAVYLLKERNLQEAAAYHEQLERALLDATEANRAKTKFLSRMSHDIRTPLNGIIGMTSIAMLDNRDPRVQADLEAITSSSQFLLSLINDILDISCIENGKLKLKLEPVPLYEFDRMIDSVVRPLMQEKHIDFEYKMNCGMQCAIVDGLRFNQIFFNLLSNAAKFTPEGGHVVFAAEKMSEDDKVEWVRFSIKDNGIGMSQEFLSRAFEPFEQMYDHGFSGQQRQGTGLGLSIVRDLTNLMNGRVTVTSELGKGSEFIVELPLGKCELPQTEEAKVVPICRPKLAGARVLLAEDNAINLRVTKRLLEHKGIAVVCAENGAKAIEVFNRSQPGEFDAVLMDVRMPELDGLEATRRLRALKRSDAAAVPIIAMTANTFESDIANCLAAGMNAHLGKPINPRKLYAALDKWLCLAGEKNKVYSR